MEKQKHEACEICGKKATFRVTDIDVQHDIGDGRLLAKDKAHFFCDNHKRDPHIKEA